MKVLEFRIILPITVEQCNIAALYMTAKRSSQETGNGEGIEIDKNEPYERTVTTPQNPDGVQETGQYTHKIMHFKSRVPGVIRWAIPEKFLHIHEESWNSFPHYDTRYQMPGVGDDFILTCETAHIPYHKGDSIPENFFNLPEDELKQRVIIYSDILDGPAGDVKDLNLHGYSCPDAGISEMKSTKKKPDQTKVPDWVNQYDGNMICVIKVVRFMFKQFGLQSAVESFVMGRVFPQTFMDSHRAIVRWADEWKDMTIEDIRAMEEETKNNAKKVKFE